MEIHQLKTFVAVAREGSITRASERLYLSQPAVSAHIKAMEDTLGLVLFERTPRGMRLTPEGQSLLVKAERTLDAHRELLAEASLIKGRLTGTLRIGAGGDASTKALGQLLSGMAERYPEVEVTLHHDSSLEILDGILNERLDAGFYNEAGDPDDRLTRLEVAHFGIYLAAPAGLVAGAQPPDWPALAKLPWICPASNTCCGQAAEQLFDSHRIRPQRIISIDRENVTRTLIAGGVGVGLLHAGAAREAQRCGEVDLICEVQQHVRVLFAHRANRDQDPLLSAARSILQTG
ncbi:LysR family transcriptional regulator [Marinobacterium arenosum]|uniref:LysR family transcriptional regulator n=1 Tax=Marinobacterium arenosum TaxID=2862496 RepID=UPI001C94D3D6|nr:LysR family transcriptional regulator [Marinobacterium arenosum]MBY4678573.1 LysR family transcriptional regulator [Marinobacterium arenosum]